MSTNATGGSENGLNNTLINTKVKTEIVRMDSCRICSSKANVMTNIFEEDDDIVEKVLFCTGIKFTKEDGLPQKMCESCLDDLYVSHRFKASCIAIAANSFQKDENVKTEVHDDGSNDYFDRDEAVSFENEDITFKRENGEERLTKELKQEQETDDRDKDWTESAAPESEVVIKKKKRGPYKKRAKKDEQPKVKKKKKTKAADEEDSTFNSAHHQKRRPRPLADTHKPEPGWVCEICGAVFLHRGSLSTHARTHRAPAFPCAQCSYRAAHKYDLTKHQRIHQGVRPYQCDMCPASFYETSNMNSHIRRNHQKVMKFSCELCGHGFYDRSKLNRHVDSHNNIKRHSCGQCGSAFTRLSYLKTHLRKRHGESPPPQRPGPQRRHVIVDVPQVEYVKPKFIAVKQDTAPS